jgi:hypothetical protein
MSASIYCHYPLHVIVPFKIVQEKGAPTQHSCLDLLVSHSIPGQTPNKEALGELLYCVTGVSALKSPRTHKTYEKNTMLSFPDNRDRLFFVGRR